MERRLEAQRIKSIVDHFIKPRQLASDDVAIGAPPKRAPTPPYSNATIFGVAHRPERISSRAHSAMIQSSSDIGM